jgi:very-short-patch-repair endonuclease
MEGSRFLNSSKNLDYRRNLRKNSTKAEQILWFHLKNRKLGDLKFRRQHSLGQYIVDFLHAESNIIIELDSDVHFSLDEQAAKDATRQLWLEGQGFTFLRFNNNEITNNLSSVLDHIYYNINKKLKT